MVLDRFGPTYRERELGWSPHYENIKNFFSKYFFEKLRKERFSNVVTREERKSRIEL